MTRSESSPCAAGMVAAFSAAEAAPRRTFMVDRLGGLSYGETCARIRKIAGLLERWGLRPGARVLLASREDRSTSVLFLALLRCGMATVLLDPDTGPDRARRLIDVSGPDAFMVEQERVAAWGLAGGARVLALGPETAPGILEGLFRPRRDGDGRFPGCLREWAPGALPETLDPDLDAYVLFTSGTTLEPKGVRISHRALFSHLETLSRVYGYRPESCIFNNLILSHADGSIQGPVAAFANGLPVVRPFPFQIQTMEEMLDALYRHRATHLIAVPTMLALLERYCAGRREAFRTRDFKLVVSCGAPLETELWRQFETTFGVPVVNVYGLTETVAGGLFAGPEPATRRHGTVGRPVDCEARIVAPGGGVCGPEQPGEVQLRGPMVMAGYLNAPEATAEVLSPDGWFRTGDLGLREPDGCYRILGRIKALIIRGGFNVHPEEVTEVLQAHPGVAEAVTFGLPDPVWGEQVVSAVAVVPGAELDEAGLISHARAGLEAQKVPSRIVFLPALPRGRSGKVALEEAAAMARAALQEDGGSGGRPDSVRAGVLAEASRCFRIPPDALGLETSAAACPEWDSMAHLEFVAGLEARFGVLMRPDDIMAIGTLGDAVRIVAALDPG